jgi:hypothetical protein
VSDRGNGEPALPVPAGEDLRAGRGDAWLAVPLRYRPDPAWNPVAEGELSARHVYTDESGAPLFKVLRFRTRPTHPAHPDKQFLSRRLDPATGRWHWGLEGADLVPYHLPRLAGAVARGETVFVVEGERDVEALEAAGLAATCNPLGALQWTPAHSARLRGADAVVLPDNDRAGIVHAVRVAAGLRGVARSVRLLLLPDLAPNGDVSDWLAHGGSAAELLRLAAEAPRDPSPEWLAQRFHLPAGADLLSQSPDVVHALLFGTGGPGAPASAAAARWAPTAFPRTFAAFERLGIAIPTSPELSTDAVAADFSAWRALRSAVDDASGDRRTMLADAFAVERARFELAVFAPVVHAARPVVSGAGDTAPPADSDDDVRAALAVGVRLETSAWDWDAWLAGTDDAPPAAETTYALVPSGTGVHAHCLHPLPALIARFCGEPRTYREITDTVAGALSGEPLREAVAALVRRQVAEMQAAGILAPGARGGSLADEMRRWLLDDEPPAAAQPLAGLIARSAAAAQEQAAALEGAGAETPDALYAAHRMDVSVMLLEVALREAGLRGVFSAEMDGWWGAADVPTRLKAVRPVLQAAAASLRESGPPPPFVMP